MALRRGLTTHLIFIGHRSGFRSQPAIMTTLEKHGRSDLAMKDSRLGRREYNSHPEAAAREVFRRFLQRRMLINKDKPELVSHLTGEKGTCIGIPQGDRLWLNGVSPPRPAYVTGRLTDKLSVDDARKVFMTSLVQKLVLRLRELPESSITYAELVKICSEACGGDRAKAIELANSLDSSAHVIVLGDAVFLRPDKVARSIEALISETIPRPDDPRRHILERMERVKAEIDRRARAQVTAELNGGLCLLLAQTMAFMRLTFWDLSWDVMEPICFFAASLHFAGAYAFFLRTSVEPSFRGYFEHRFMTKQRKLMAAEGFDVDTYDRLRNIFYPEPGGFDRVGFLPLNQYKCNFP